MAEVAADKTKPLAADRSRLTEEARRPPGTPRIFDTLLPQSSTVMRALRVTLFCGVVALMASCQTSRPTFVARTFGHVATFPADSASTVLLLHDSQGPQGTRAMMTAAEVASFRQQ